MSMFEILLFYSGWPVMRGRVWFWCFNSNILYQFADQAYAQPSFFYPYAVGRNSWISF